MIVAGLILAAGRGSRMGELTAKVPKCLVELGGKALLRWQLESLRGAGIGRVAVVRGYAGHCLQGGGDFETVDNPRWAETNMLSSLLCADAWVRDAFGHGVERLVVSYSDIVYACEHVRRLLDCPQSICITYDTLWEDLWRLRLEDILSDAERFLEKDGLLCEIGGRASSVEGIRGQYMGLLCLDCSGWQTLLDVCGRLGPAVDRTDMTSFLRRLLAEGVAVGAVGVAGKWCEVDSETDLEHYRQALTTGSWSHDWRQERMNHETR